MVVFFQRFSCFFRFYAFKIQVDSPSSLTMIDDDDEELLETSAPSALPPSMSVVEPPQLKRVAWPDVRFVVEESKGGKKEETQTCVLRFEVADPTAVCSLPGPFDKLVLRLNLKPPPPGAPAGAKPELIQVDC